jgi:hypothetical protein
MKGMLHFLKHILIVGISTFLLLAGCLWLVGCWLAAG